MKLKLIWKLVRQNIKSLREILVPFILAVSLMFALEYVMLSLIQNDYIQKRHENLPQLIRLANVMTGILTVIFIIYANNFVMKRRKQEFALKMILGMEKKHLRLMLFVETVVQFIICSLLSIIGGYLFGNLIFMMLNRMVKSKGISLMDYPFDMSAAVICLSMLTGILLLLFILNNFILARQSPIKLLQGQQAGEKKSRKYLIVIFFIAGAAALSYGYYTALTANGVIGSLQKIFYAVLAVAIGTYLLFMSLTLLVLQTLQNIPSIYYKSKNFLTISGLLSRMRANAVSLASITMLCTFLVVTLGMTLTAYRGIEQQISGTQVNDYSVTISEYKKDESAPVRLKKFMNAVNKIADVDQYRISTNIMIGMYNDYGTMTLLEQKSGRKIDDALYTYVMTEQGFNKLYRQHVHLNDYQIAASSNADKYNHFKTITLAGENKQVLKLDKDYIGSKISIDGLFIVVKDINELEKLVKYYPNIDPKTGEKVQQPISTSLEFNLKAGEKAFKKQMPMLEKKYQLDVISKDQTAQFLYDLNGGLIFIGIVVSIILLIGMFLILYYKQISEGYEDKKNYQIMKKVGLPQKLIKRTISTQILWVFILPIVIAVIHTLFASKIIYNLLGLIGVRDWGMFITSYGLVLLAIMFVYGLMYVVTSRTYYHIIDEE